MANSFSPVHRATDRSNRPASAAPLVAALVVAVAASVLAGCGGDPETRAGDSTTGNGGAATTEAGAGDGSTSVTAADAGSTVTAADAGSTVSGETSATTAGETTTSKSPTTTSGSSSTSAGPAPVTGPYPTAELAVIVSHPDHGDVAYTVICGGATAEIAGDGAGVDPEATCLALTDPAVVQRLTTRPENRACTLQYGGPDVASLTGAIDGTAVRASVDRKDGCGIADWEQLLADLLPPAAGLS